MNVKVLEIGKFIVPAYAGMILAEQGFDVQKWILEDRKDPIQELEKGDELWSWINHKKDLRACHAKNVENFLVHNNNNGNDMIVIDNIKASTWKKWDIKPEELAKKYRAVWVSMRSEVGETSFDMLAQARAWGDIAPYIPFYIGDTAGGLWLAFTALSRLAQFKTNHHCIYHATTLAKLVEGEGVVGRPTKEEKPSQKVSPPWDKEGTYFYDKLSRSYEVKLKGDDFFERARDDQWRKDNLKHKEGRYTI